jgi:hypothetical protein
MDRFTTNFYSVPGWSMMYPEGMSTTNIAIPDVGLSSVSVQLKQLFIVISDLFRPWKYS